MKIVHFRVRKSAKTGSGTVSRFGTDFRGQKKVRITNSIPDILAFFFPSLDVGGCECCFEAHFFAFTSVKFENGRKNKDN